MMAAICSWLRGLQLHTTEGCSLRCNVHSVNMGVCLYAKPTNVNNATFV